MIYIVMGVSGCGKSTVGKALAKDLGLAFYDGDDFHSTESIKKMSLGNPLTDNDREPWLTSLAQQFQTWGAKGGAVLACSALKQSYRDILTSHYPAASIVFVYLKGEQELLATRLRKRNAHFMPESLLNSQLDTLEPPVNAITVQLDNSVEHIVLEILQAIREQQD